MVASQLSCQRPILLEFVSIPFIAGQWSLPLIVRIFGELIGFVSIPFIAGQWSLPIIWLIGVTFVISFQSPSLRGSGRFARAKEEKNDGPRCFNPLHCGAVVASLDGALRRLAESCFNPLHCGAVVASRPPMRRRATSSEVSIPFIAGQWSLHCGAGGADRRRQFQSPSLRGSGRFTEQGRRSVRNVKFQSPSLRGSGRF